jgi:hypothetical protein
VHTSGCCVPDEHVYGHDIDCVLFYNRGADTDAKSQGGDKLHGIYFARGSESEDEMVDS